MSNVADLFNRGSSQDTVFDGIIAKDVESPYDLAPVIVPAFDPDLIFAEAPWQSNGDLTPRAGDHCVVVLGATDEDGTPEAWIAAWWAPNGSGVRFFIGEPDVYEADGYYAWAILDGSGGLETIWLTDEGTVELDASRKFAVGPHKPNYVPMAWWDTANADLWLESSKPFRDAGHHFYVGPTSPSGSGPLIWVQTEFGGPDDETMWVITP